MEKSKILATIENFTADQLIEQIKAGIVTLKELNGTGNFSIHDSRYKQITKWQKELDIKDDESWERARYGTEMDLRGYISNYPFGKYVVDAKATIRHLEDDRRRANAEKQIILEKLRVNHNSFTPGEIKDFLKNTISETDLIDCGFPLDIVSTINTFKRPELELGEVPQSIPDGFTEVYFWGIPGSGKTCALAAILNTASRAGYLEMSTGPGFNYMLQLKNIFEKNQAILPRPTNVEDTQYLPFVLKKGDDKPRSVSLIELSGEIFECFLHKNAGKTLSPRHENTFNTLIKFLNGNNRKIHFFFIDYHKQNEIDDKGYLQSDYLNSASIFFNNNDIFKKSTDAIFIVLTKSDLLNCPKEDRLKHSIEYLKSESFLAFTNTLKNRCKELSINAGKLTVEPFSLGNVYLKFICDFDNSSAFKIIDILLDRIAPSQRSFFDIFNK